MSEIVVGIDLGTTNSSVAVVQDGRPVLLPVDGSPLLPSVVGLEPDGSLLVGQAARNQYLLYPERTIRSIKRRMGEQVRLSMGEQEFSPVEIAAMILRRLKGAAEVELGGPVQRAVITVPAYFSDAQRSATKEAGEVAGLRVERILNEPTAAALCYAQEDESDSTVMVYDLGGGTFDVSIVRSRGQVTEVLSSHGDTALGGDDFDLALMARLRRSFEEANGVDLDGDLKAIARLSRAAEHSKILLSTESYVQVREEHLCERDGAFLHLDMELSRRDYEELIKPMLERTKDSVQTALREAGILARELDHVILVGGSTRTPLVREILQGLMGIVPRVDVEPEIAVAMGAALQAARIAGHEAARILVDVTPFTFGTSFLGTLYGLPSPHCYGAIIHRNTPLPTRQTEVFYTVADGQKKVEVEVFQGEEPDARLNLRLGRFMVEGLDEEEESGSPILFDLKLDLDGILQVEVTEKHTGLKKKVVIEDAFRKLSDEELERSRERVIEAFGDDAAPRAWEGDAQVVPPSSPPVSAVEPPQDVAAAPEGLVGEERMAWTTARSLLEKAERMVTSLSDLDSEEVENITTQLRMAMEQGDFKAIRDDSGELADVLFYLE